MKASTSDVPSWKQLVGDVVASLPRDFTLADVLAYRDLIARHFPSNRFVDAKIRQTLQVLRDRGVLRFRGSGRYERLDAEPVFSPLIDLAVTANYVSRAQAARVALETWASYNLYCLNCERDMLDAMPPNTPVADFACLACHSRYQLKAKNGRFGSRITGAAYRPVLEAIRANMMPEHIMVEFDTRFGTVVFVDAIPGRLISEDRVIPRTPLAAGARRAGWQGCVINVEGLPSVRLVAPAGIDRGTVRPQWRELASGPSSGSQ